MYRLSTRWVLPQRAHINLKYSDLDLLKDLNLFAFCMFVVLSEGTLCSVFNECTCDFIVTFSNTILRTYRLCKHLKAQVFVSSLSNQKAKSVFYVAFLENNRHSTINYNKKDKRTDKKTYIYSYI